MLVENIKLSNFKVDTVLDQKLDQLYFNAFETKYITKEALEGNERLHFFDVHYEMNFRIQINHVRSKYSKSMAGAKPLPLPKGAKCPICIENVGSKGKENLEQIPIQLEEEDFFVQLTPFPLYHHHFVLITKEHKPMEVSLGSFQKQLNFLDRMPNYVVCSNSDKEGAGASILSHLHYQVFKSLQLPIFEAKKTKSEIIDEVEVSICHYPLTVFKLVTTKRNNLEKVFDKIVRIWRTNNENNTFNTVLRVDENHYEAYLIFRNADFNTPKELLKYKYEGIGVIEACGEGILPTPEGDQKEEIFNDIRTEGKKIIINILKGLNPHSTSSKHTFFQNITQ